MNNKKFQQSVKNHDRFPRSMKEAFGTGVYHTFGDEKKNNSWIIISLIIFVALIIVSTIIQFL